MLTSSFNEQLIAHWFDEQPDSVIWLVPVFAHDKTNSIVDFTIEYCNKIAAAAYGLQPYDLMGESLLSSTIMDSSARFHVLEQCLHVWNTGEPMEFTDHCLHFDKYYKVQRRKIQEGILSTARDCSHEVKIELRRKEQERIYQQLLDASGDGVLLMEAIRDRNNNIVDFEITFCNKWGRKIAKFPSDAIGKTLFEVLPHLRNHEQWQLHKKVVETGEPLQFETTFRNADGEEYGWFIVSLTKLGDGVISRYTDISIRRQNEEKIREQKEELQGILNASINAVLACEAVRDKKGHITDLLIGRVNEAFTKVNGINAEVAEGSTFLSLFPGADAAALFAAYAQVITTGVSLRTEMYYCSDNLDGWFDISAVKRGQNGVVISYNDITPVKKTQLELEKKVQELKRSNEILEEFAYASSHDLKEPVRKIHLFADRLKHELRENLTENQLTLFERMERAAKRMTLLIDDLLTYSHVSRGADHFESVDLNEKVKNVLSDLDAEMEEKGAVVTVGHLPLIQGQGRQIEQLFQNLITNAIKYSKPGVTPQVSICACEMSSKGISVAFSAEPANKRYNWIKVRDNGIGFPQADAERIFNVFTRLHGNAEYRGTGVGLSIVQKVVQNHGGLIWAESAVGKGSTFNIVFPCL
jgi:signal transduction histidine kinase